MAKKKDGRKSRRSHRWVRRNVFRKNHEYFSPDDTKFNTSNTSDMPEKTHATSESTPAKSTNSCGKENHEQRLPHKIFTASCNPLTPDIMPSRLRPKPELSVDHCAMPKPERIKGNVIVDVTKCEVNFNTAIREHLQRFPDCPGYVIFDPEGFSKWGLGTAGKLICSSHCGFYTSKLKFFQEVDKGGRGRKAAAINIQLQVGLTKQPLGNTGMRELLTSIDVPSPAESSMQYQTNKVSDAFMELCRDELRKNRELVREIIALRKGITNMDDALVEIVAMSDVAYNNPIKGQCFFQPGTQCWAPCFVGEPGLTHIPIAFQVKSKICSCSSKIHGPHCKKTFPETKAMGNAEFDLGSNIASEILDTNGLGISTIVTDGDSSMHRGVKLVMETRGVKTSKGDCTRHITRSISRNIRKAKLSNKCLGNKTQKQRIKNKSTLASFLERRASMEFKKAYQRHGRNIQHLINACQMAKIGIIGCIQGFSNVCRKGTLVCLAHKKRGGEKPPPGLPEGKFIKPNSKDVDIIERWLDNKLGEEAIRGQQYNLTTNRCEAAHLTIAKSVPKARNHRRNFEGRSKSAAHSLSLGVVGSILEANMAMGVKNTPDSPAAVICRVLRSRESYHKQRRKSLAYRIAKIKMKARIRRIRQRFHGSDYSTGINHPVIRHDHSYNNDNS